MVAPKSAGYSHLGAPNRDHARNDDVDPERDASTSSSTGSGFDVRTTKPITASTFAHEKVFPLLQRCKHEVEASLDTPFSYDALRNADLTWKYVTPLVTKLTTSDGKKKHKPPACLIYCLLVARVQFLQQAEGDLAYAGVNTARADLCELLAIKILSTYGTSSTSSEHLYVLTAPFNPWAGCTVDMFAARDVTPAALDALVAEGKDDATNALELAIGSQARRFVKSPLVQHVVKAIYEGDVMYSLESNHALITDNYKSKPVVEIYDWRSRPFLDHYRLRVPYIRKTLELVAFASVFVLFMIVQATYNLAHVTVAEVLFIVWSCGFALDEFAALYENGVSSYFLGAFNVLDSLYCLIFFVYLAIRTHALTTVAPDATSQWAFDVLSLAGCVLAPRLMVSLIPDHVVVMALGRMARQFALFMVLAALTASGFLVTFHILARGSWSVRQISWLMLRIWLSGAFLGFDAAQQFHPVFGPILMVAFAVLSQTLLLTILISLLSNTFAQVQTDAETEVANQLAVRTLERVKSDPLASYTTPQNLVAFAVLFPTRAAGASPRTVHRVHAFLARVLNLPTLVVLAVRTRFRAQSRSRSRKFGGGMTTTLTGFGGTVLRETQRVFERWTDYDWDEGGEAVRRVFEYDVDPRAYRTDAERLADAERAHAEQQQQQQRRRAEEDKKEEEGEQERIKKKKKEEEKQMDQDAHRAGAAGWDWRNFDGAKAAASKMKPSRTAGGTRHDAVADATAAEEGGAIAARLDRIEDALEILLTEMVRNRRSADGDIEGATTSTPTTASAGPTDDL
ncbi:hypothetical protein JCM11491_003715 [Sporobolomyces phaffii]